MKLAGRLILERFGQKHADVRASVLALIAELEAAEWRTFHDLQQQFPSASRIGSHIVFNLRGNRYRVDIKVSFQLQSAIVVRVGTHAEYDRWSFE